MFFSGSFVFISPVALFVSAVDAVIGGGCFSSLLTTFDGPDVCASELPILLGTDVGAVAACTGALAAIIQWI